jgi:NhaA family Na+:H+ antiporter
VTTEPEPPRRPSIPPEASRAAARAVRRLLAPVQAFLRIQAASGIVLVAVTAIAMVSANSPWHGEYHDLWHTPVGFGVGRWSFVQPLHFWVNDVLMTIFFFVVGLEIRREIHAGELADWKRAALPLAAALGGMLVPAAIYMALNHGRAGEPGWGVPMATDIAFAVGVLALLGPRVPGALRILLLALAVIDDIGAILVIAIFYTSGVAFDGLGISLLGVTGVFVFRQLGVRSRWAYVIPGVVVWLGLHDAGVHPSLAGVVMGLLTPARAWFGKAGFAAYVTPRIERTATLESHELLAELDRISVARREAVPPTEYLVHRLHRYVAFGIMPLFALANAGVELGGADLAGDALYVVIGIALGLVVGKTIGITAACWLSCRVGIAARPRDTTWRGILLVGMTGGIGFTMSLFTAHLAFPRGALLDTAKLGILIGSTVAALVGLAYGAATLRPPRPGEPAFADEATAERSSDL